MRDAIVWHGAEGRAVYGGWTAAMQERLDEEYQRAVRGEPGVAVDPPPNQRELGDLAAVHTVLAERDAWARQVAAVARCLFVEIHRRVPWSIVDLDATSLAALFGDDDFRRGADGAYEVEVTRAGKVTPAPAWIVARFVERNHWLGADPLDTIGRALLWCRDHLTHAGAAAGAPGPETAAGAEALWHYRGWAPVSRMIEGTVGPLAPAARHYTVGCWGTTGLLRNALRALNIPVTQGFSHPDAPRNGHSLTEFPSVQRYLSHGDDPYSLLTKDAGIVDGRELLIGRTRFRGWFGPDVSDRDRGRNVERHPFELCLREAWRSAQPAGWTHVRAIAMRGRRLVMGYASNTGAYAIGRLVDTGVAPALSGTWDRGWTHLVPFVRGHDDYLFAYDAHGGAATVVRFLRTDEGTGFAQVWSGPWTAGWDVVESLPVAGVPHLLTYRAADGQLAVHQFNPDLHGGHIPGAARITPGLRAFVRVVRDGHDAWLAYDPSSGRARLDHVAPVHDGVTPRWHGAWDAGSDDLILLPSGRGSTVLLHARTTGDLLVSDVEPAAGVTGPASMSPLRARGPLRAGVTAFDAFDLDGHGALLLYARADGALSLVRYCLPIQPGG